MPFIAPEKKLPIPLVTLLAVFLTPEKKLDTTLLPELVFVPPDVANTLVATPDLPPAAAIDVLPLDPVARLIPS